MKTRISKIALLLVLVLALVVPMMVMSVSAAETETLTLDCTGKTNGTKIDNQNQVWKTEDESIVVHNVTSGMVGSLTSSYAKFNKNSVFTIDCQGMTKITINCSAGNYAKLSKLVDGSNQPVSGARITADYTSTFDTFIVIEFDAPTDQIIFQAWDGMIYAKSFVIEREVGPQCAHENKETTTTDATCTEDGLTVVHCKDCDKDIEKTVLPATGHKYVNEVCENCGAIEPNFSGEFYIRAMNNGTGYDMMAVLTGTRNLYFNCEKDTYFKEIINRPDIEKMFVFEKNEDGTYYIYAKSIHENGYIACTSTSNGTCALVSKDQASKVKIDYAATEGMVNITLADDPTIYLAAYYGIDFEWIKDGYKDIKLVPIEQENGNIGGARLSIADSVSVLYRIDAKSEGIVDYNVNKYSMKFTINDYTVTVKESVVEIDGEYYIAFEGVAPHMMGDNIHAELYYDGRFVDVAPTYSVKAYAEAMLPTADAELKQLLVNMLAYGAAAQLDQDYKTNALVNAGIEGATTETSNENVLASEGEAAIAVRAGVRYTGVNKLFVVLNATKYNEKDIVVFVDGEEIELYENFAYTDGIKATDFDKAVVFEIRTVEYTEDEEGKLTVPVYETIQTVTFSVNSYVYAVQNAGNTNAALAIALYNYGVAAEAYAAKA